MHSIVLIISNISLICIILNMVQYAVRGSGLFKAPVQDGLALYMNFVFSSVPIFLLMFASVNNDFSIYHIFSNSSLQTPFLYKIALVWSTHESSILFINFIYSICALLIVATTKKHHNYIHSYKLHLLFASIFAIYSLCFANPFLPTSLFGVHDVGNGVGYNPLLADNMVAIHPPILLASNAAVLAMANFMITTSSITTGASATSMVQTRILNILVKWIFCALSIGILLGSFWAYHELGWGGYWFWDPVENVSLIPWFILLILIHTTKHQKNFQISRVMAGACGIAVLLGMMATRSSVVSSVHSFGARPNQFYSTATFVILIAIDIYFIYEVIKLSPHNTKIVSQYNRLAVYSLATIACSILFGTFAPVIYNLITMSTVALSDKYYHQITFSLMVLVIPVMVFVAYKYRNMKALKLGHLFYICFIFSVIMNHMGSFDISVEFGEQEIGVYKLATQRHGVGVKITGVKYTKEAEYFLQQFDIEVDMGVGGSTMRFTPENRLYFKNDMMTAKQSAVYGVFSDVLVHANHAGGGYGVTILYRPFMTCVWVFGLVIAATPLLFARTSVVN